MKRADRGSLITIIGACLPVGRFQYQHLSSIVLRRKNGK